MGSESARIPLVTPSGSPASSLPCPVATGTFASEPQARMTVRGIGANRVKLDAVLRVPCRCSGPGAAAARPAPAPPARAPLATRLNVRSCGRLHARLPSLRAMRVAASQTMEHLEPPRAPAAPGAATLTNGRLQETAQRALSSRDTRVSSIQRTRRCQPRADY